LSSEYDLTCYGCGAGYGADHEGPCGACGEPLSIRALATPAARVFEQAPDSMWHYADLLPIRDAGCVVSIGEGATPLVAAPGLAADLGFGALLVKNEMANPTGSFKDRQVSVGVSRARELGADTVAVVSSGNVACAASAYAARSGLRAVLVMHGHAAASKMALASVYGGLAVRVDTPAASRAFDLCLEACAEYGWYHLSTAGMYNRFNVEGAKTIAYELYYQTGGDLPEWVVAPVGGGGLLGGIWRGFLDLERLGLIDRVPRLAGVQASGCAPLKKAVDEGTAYLDTLRDPWPNPQTIAGGIADDILFDGHTVLPAIRRTDGRAIAVDDDATLEGQRALAAREGLLCEPTSAVVIAALAALADEARGARVCCIVTGSGAKDLAAVQDRVRAPVVIEPSLGALARAVGL